MKLSDNFYLSEFTRSQTATRRGIDMSITNPIHLANVKQLVLEILQPLRDELGSVLTINSGYRPLELNKAIGGSKTSDHMTASAADISSSVESPMQIATTIEDMGIPFGQLILEFGSWVHVSLGEQCEILTAYKVDGVTFYEFGLNERVST